MDPRLKAYRKQSQSLSEPDQAETEATPDVETPVVRSPQLPRFDEPAAPKAAPAALAKTVAPEPSPANGPSTDKSLRKVAKFLILLGQDEAAKVVRHLDPSQIEALGKEIAGIKKIDPVEAETILREFGYIAGQTAAKGGSQAARSILDRAFGPAKAKSIFRKAVPHAAEKPFSYFAGQPAEAVTALLGAESPQVLSVVVPFLDKPQAAAFLKTLSAERRLDLVKRLAKMEQVPSNVVAQVDQTLQERLHNLSPANTEAVDGKARLADILRHMSADKEAALLQSLDRGGTGLAEDMRQRMFTAADLVRVADDGFEDLLRARDDARVALLWLAAPELRPKIEANISARRLLLVKAETDLLSDTPVRELAKELRLFVDEVRHAVRDGAAALIGGEDYV
jgi:flagellar motor switch protein FliG